MAARAVTRIYDDALRPVGLRATQLAVMVAVAADEAISISALAIFMGMDRTTLSRNLRPLEKEGFVTVGREGRYRARALVITNKGRVRLRQALPLWENAQRTLKRKLGNRDWEAIRSDLDRLTGVI